MASYQRFYLSINNGYHMAYNIQHITHDQMTGPLKIADTIFLAYFNCIVSMLVLFVDVTFNEN